MISPAFLVIRLPATRHIGLNPGSDLCIRNVSDSPFNEGADLIRPCLQKAAITSLWFNILPIIG